MISGEKQNARWSTSSMNVGYSQNVWNDADVQKSIKDSSRGSVTVSWKQSSCFMRVYSIATNKWAKIVKMLLCTQASARINFVDQN